jgi:hypothetical protein
LTLRSAGDWGELALLPRHSAGAAVINVGGDGWLTCEQDLTLSGQRPKGSSPPTIAAFPFSLSSTVTVGVSVTLVIKNLTITGGSSDLGAGIFNNQGAVTLTADPSLCFQADDTHRR